MRRHFIYSFMCLNQYNEIFFIVWLQIYKEGTRHLFRFSSIPSKFHRRRLIRITIRNFHICRPPAQIRAFIIIITQTPVTRTFQLRNRSAIHHIIRHIFQVREAALFTMPHPRGTPRIITARLIWIHITRTRIISSHCQVNRRQKFHRA